MLTDNPWFGWRFFPPAVARAPRPLYLAAQKPANTVRIFVFGESAAMGDPAPAYGFARQLDCLLRARHPGQKIEVVNTAMTAINSHVIRQIAHDCQPREGDFWLVFAGNNEVIGPFGAGTVFGRQVPSRTTVRTALALKTTRVGQLLTRTFQGEAEPKQWEGLEFFLQWKIAPDSPRLERVYASFNANLEDIAGFGRDSGATVLLSTVPVNLYHFPPLASVHRPDLSPEQLADWEGSFSAGIKAQAEERFSDALTHFNRAAALDEGFAQLAFERARCELALDQPAAAAASFRRARDLDALRFRADSRLNDIIRQTSKADGVSLVDADAEFARFGHEDLFYDHVHLNFTGNHRMALVFAAELEKQWPGARTNDSPWLTEVEVAQRLAWTSISGALARRCAPEWSSRPSTLRATSSRGTSAGARPWRRWPPRRQISLQIINRQFPCRPMTGCCERTSPGCSKRPATTRVRLRSGRR
jgi:tetratricopeptide (TPR) repeat protein